MIATKPGLSTIASQFATAYHRNRAHTRSNAFLVHRENDLGSIQKGRFADLVVIDRDYLTIPADQIEQITPVLTGERGVIGRGQVEIQHPEDRRQEAFSLPQGPVEDEPERQRGLGGEIGILQLPATRADDHGLPGGDRASLVAVIRGVNMKSSDRELSEERGVRFVPAKGSVIGGIAKDKTARITDAMADLKLGIDGLASQLHGVSDGNQWAHALGPFARTCSVFLRKNVLGDYGKRETRLLDDRVLESIGLRFDRLRKIPHDRRREIEVGFGLAAALLEATKLDDQTLEPQATYRFRAGPQEVKLSIEWPLPGAADWTRVPSEEAPWPVSADQLFQMSAGTDLSCDEWLAQQVVLFDGKGISLKEMIQTVATFEGAHSINVGRLATVEGEEASQAAKDPAPHILNAVTVCGIRYAHLIVIECALYLYEKLLDERSIDRPRGDIYVLKLGVGCSPEQVESPRPDWVKFQGGMMISFSGAPRVFRYKIRAVN